MKLSKGFKIRSMQIPPKPSAKENLDIRNPHSEILTKVPDTMEFTVMESGQQRNEEYQTAFAWELSY